MQINRFQWLRWAGLAIIVAGVLWVAFALVLSSQPQGCVGSACDLPGQSYRSWGMLSLLFFFAAILLLIGGMAAVARSAWNIPGFGIVGRAGLLLSTLGGLLIACAIMVQALFGDSEFIPFLIIPGWLALCIGSLLLGVALLRTRMVPRWVGILLLLSALILLGFNDQDVRALLAVPLGLSWAIVGVFLWMSQERAQSEHVATQKPDA